MIEKNTRSEIDEFLSCVTIAVAGASRKEKSFSASVIAHLRLMGYEVLSVNPNFTENNSERKEYKTLADLPDTINHLLVLTSPQQTTTVIIKAIEKGIGNIWIQQKSDTPAALELCRVNHINLIANQCIFMFSHPEGMHKFHYGMKRLFGTLPVKTV